MTHLHTVLAQGDWTSGLKLPKRHAVNELIQTDQRTRATGVAPASGSFTTQRRAVERSPI